MPPELRKIVERQRGPVLFGALVAAATASGLTDYVPLAAALGVALALAVVAMTLREWVLIERGREVSEDQRLLMALEAEHQRLLIGLERATSSSHAEYSESIHQVWYIEPDGSDRGSTTYETRVFHPDSMAWRRVKLFATADLPTPSVSSMDFVAVEAVAGETEAFRVMEGGGLADYVVFFRTPVTSSTARSWTVRYRWPGLWTRFAS